MLIYLLPGLNDPPTSLSSQSKPKLNEMSNQWTSLQVHRKRSVEPDHSSLVHVSQDYRVTPLQAPAAGVDLFGSAARSGPAVPPAEPAAATHSLQDLQDLAMMGFSDHKRYTGMHSASSFSQG